MSELRALARADGTGAARRRRAGAVAVWPLGSTEQHGPHLVTAFDAASAAAVAEAAIARAEAATVCLPPLRFGASEHWLALGGTLSLRPATLVAVLEDVIRSVELAGFRALVLVNGHMGNVGPALAALGPRELRVELVSYWSLLDETELAGRMERDDGGVGHAGEFETALALHLGGLARDERIAAVRGTDLGDGPGSRSAAILRAPQPLAEAPDGVYGHPQAAGSFFDAAYWPTNEGAYVDGRWCINKLTC